MQTNKTTFSGGKIDSNRQETANVKTSPPGFPLPDLKRPPGQEFGDVLKDDTLEEISSKNLAEEREIPDQLDEVLIVTLPARRWEVEPGNTIALPVTVLNNSHQKLSVRVHVEGWLDEGWVDDPYVQTGLGPGERSTLELALSLPRHSGVEAGDYPLAVVVCSPEEPLRLVRLGFTLRVLPVKRLAIQIGRAARPATWWRRTLNFSLRLSNQGNCPITVHLEGRTATPVGSVHFPSGEAFTLRAGQPCHAILRLTVHRLPWIGLRGRELPVTVRAFSEEGEMLAQAHRTVEVHPILGAWQLAAVAALATVAATSALLLIAIGIFLMRYTTTPPQRSVAQEPAPAVIVVTLNQPVAPVVDLRSAPPEPLDDAPRLQPDPSAPLVLPDQVTAPGSGGPIRSIRMPPTNAGALQPNRTMTYAQMFQTIAAQYDLDWRMLAAQAYVESGFDSLALSSAGAMGLMQVLPTTWREWAPAVGASDPFDSYSNVQVAAVYLDYLRTQLAQQGRPEKEWMLVAYHWGINNLSAFLSEGGDWQTLPELHRRYAEDILRIARTLP